MGLSIIYEIVPAWISNHTPSKVWDGITYPFLNFNGCTVEVWEWISNFIPHIIMGVITYPCWTMLVKGGPGGWWCLIWHHRIWSTLACGMVWCLTQHQAIYLNQCRQTSSTISLYNVGGIHIVINSRKMLGNESVRCVWKSHICHWVLWPNNHCPGLDIKAYPHARGM